MMKNTVILSLITLVLFPISLFAQWSGSGTQAAPYLITSANDLVTLSTNVNNGTNYSEKYFKMDVAGGVLDMSGIDFTPIGHAYYKEKNFDDATPIGGGNVTSESSSNAYPSRSFAGIFDGNNNTIVNLTINTSITTKTANGTKYTLAGTGLFGYLKVPGAVKNLTLDHASITATVTDGTTDYSHGVGALVGFSRSNTSVSNCAVTNSTITSISGNSSTSVSTGAVVGLASGKAVIDGCTSIGNTVSGDDYVGGIAGYSGGTLSNCTAGNNTLNATGEHVGNISSTSEGTGSTNIDELTAETSFTLIVNKWNLVGSIVEKLEDLNKNDGTNDLAVVGFDYTTNAWSEYYLSIKDDNNAINQGEGYFVYVFQEDMKQNTLSNSITTLSKGNGLSLLSSGSVSVSLSNENGSAGQTETSTGKWFALGNPFDKPLIVSQVISSLGNNVQGGTVYTFNSADNSWNTLLGGQTIAAGQGFMIAGKNGNSLSGNLSYPAKKSSSEYINNNIIFTSKAYNFYSNAQAYMDKNSKNGFDGNDAYIMLSSNKYTVEPYFIVDNKDILINSFESLPYECPINFHASKESETEFYISNNPEDIEISIVDFVDNSQTVISDGTKFTFTAYEGENEGRFLIKFAPSKNVSLTEVTDSEINVNIYNNNKEIFINGENLTHIQVINSLGQTVYNKNISGNSYSCNLNTPSGAYIVKIQTLNGTKTQKIIVK